MTPGRLKEIIRMAKRATPAKLHDLYMEVYGADYAGKVTNEIARASIQAACRELLDKPGRLAKGFQRIAPAPREATPEAAPSEEPAPKRAVRAPARRAPTLEPP